MPGDRAAGGVFLWLPFFAQAKKVTRSPSGERKLCTSQKRKQEQKLDSGFRRNDEKKKTKRKPQGRPIPTQPSP
jgi:hypothetical protein